MDVFIGNLSPRTTQSDLVTFFKGFAKDARFQIHDKNYDDGTSTRYAVATIEPDKLALKAIKKLNGKVLNTNIISVREFLHRSYGNERRAVGWRDKPWHGVERRACERRRKAAAKPSDFDQALAGTEVEEKVDVDSLQVEARGGFARKY